MIERLAVGLGLRLYRTLAFGMAMAFGCDCIARWPWAMAMAFGCDCITRWLLAFSN